MGLTLTCILLEITRTFNSISPNHKYLCNCVQGFVFAVQTNQ